MDKVPETRLKRYFKVTESALDKAKKTPENLDITDARARFLDMVERYLSDAKHFNEEGKKVDAFAAINYAHGWLDAGAVIGLWDVDDDELFTRDSKTKKKT
tara:strand:+ start:357 stop:659 length:303 start_codon:yes stop_codon:yes gene_type:complete